MSLLLGSAPRFQQRVAPPRNATLGCTETGTGTKREPHHALQSQARNDGRRVSRRSSRPSTRKPLRGPGARSRGRRLSVPGLPPLCLWAPPLRADRKGTAVDGRDRATLPATASAPPPPDVEETTAARASRSPRPGPPGPVSPRRAPRAPNPGPASRGTTPSPHRRLSRGASRRGTSRGTRTPQGGRGLLRAPRPGTLPPPASPHRRHSPSLAAPRTPTVPTGYLKSPPQAWGVRGRTGDSASHLHGGPQPLPD